MDNMFSGVASETKPDFWYGIPHGYEQLDLHPTLERIEGLVEELLSLPDEVRARAEEVFRFYTGIVTLLNSQQVQGCAIGLHPDANGGISFSIFTVSSLPTAGLDPKLVIADLLGVSTEREDEGMLPMELPCGLGILAEKVRSTTAPGRPREGSVMPREEPVWQGTVAVAGTGAPDIIVMQLVSAAVDLADDYRNVLLGIASTLTFSDPSLQDTQGDVGDPETTSTDDTVRMVFG